MPEAISAESLARAERDVDSIDWTALTGEHLPLDPDDRHERILGIAAVYEHLGAQSLTDPA